MRTQAMPSLLCLYRLGTHYSYEQVCVCGRSVGGTPMLRPVMVYRAEVWVCEHWLSIRNSYLVGYPVEHEIKNDWKWNKKVFPNISGPFWRLWVSQIGKLTLFVILKNFSLQIRALFSHKKFLVLLEKYIYFSSWHLFTSTLFNNLFT